MKLLTYDPVSCDRCAAPGHCCKAFPLTVQIPIGSTPAQVETIMNERSHQPLPFKPLRRAPKGTWHRKPDEGHEYWLFNCPKLLPDGRCGAYEERPETCRIYEPGNDEMCFHAYATGWEGQVMVPQTPSRYTRQPPPLKKEIEPCSSPSDSESAQ